MMKNFMPSIKVILVFLILIMSLALLMIDFSSVYSFFIYMVKVIMFFIGCYCSGYGLAYGITRIKDVVTGRHSKRLDWYIRMGFYESAYLVELRGGRKFSKHYWKMFF